MSPIEAQFYPNSLLAHLYVALGNAPGDILLRSNGSSKVPCQEWSVPCQEAFVSPPPKTQLSTGGFRGFSGASTMSSAIPACLLGWRH